MIGNVLQAKEDALIHCGPPCSSWIWVNRGTSRRTREEPEGDAGVNSVLNSNARLGFDGNPRARDGHAADFRVCPVIAGQLMLFVETLRITMRLVLVLLLALSRSAHVMVEQPRSSLMPFFAPFQALAKQLLGTSVGWRTVHMPETQGLSVKVKGKS